jgi:hypothetical protein
MVRFAPADILDPETSAAEPLGQAPVAVRKPRARRLAEPGFAPPNSLSEQMFPQWARLPTTPAVGADAHGDAAFCAGARLALLDATLRENPPFAGALRQRLALRAATACAALGRHREDSCALRDAEHLNAGGGATGPAGRLHRLWRGFAGLPAGIDEESLRWAADLLGLPQDHDLQDHGLEALADTLRPLEHSPESPLAAAARAGSATLQALDGAARVDAKILAFWLSDLVLARRLGWQTPIPLLATTLAHPGLRPMSFGGGVNSRTAPGRRPCPDSPEWALYCARAYALAAQEAYGLAGELSRRSAKLLALTPKLRAKGADRVIQLLLGDDAVAPATAAKLAKLSDRASRRLFERLVELGAVRELSGRPSFRLYGL